MVKCNQKMYNAISDFDFARIREGLTRDPCPFGEENCAFLHPTKGNSNLDLQLYNENFVEQVWRVLRNREELENKKLESAAARRGNSRGRGQLIIQK